MLCPAFGCSNDIKLINDNYPRSTLLEIHDQAYDVLDPINLLPRLKQQYWQEYCVGGTYE